MIKIFILNIVLTVIHFVSVETTARWYEGMINSGNAYGILASASVNSLPDISCNTFSDTSSNNTVKSFGISQHSYSTKLFLFQKIDFDLVNQNTSNNRKYFESGNSPPEQIL